MWKLPVACVAHLVAVGRCGIDATSRDKAVRNLLPVDIPLTRWKRVPVDGRVTELLHGTHFDDVLKDAPDNVRPPSLIYFHDSLASGQVGTANVEDFMKVSNQGIFGDRDRLFIGSYDVGEAPRRIWFNLTPERNLTHRFLLPTGKMRLPKLVFIPRKCDGWTKWCDPGGKARIIGGDCYVEQCSDWQVIEPDRQGAWVEKVQELIRQEGTPEIGIEVKDRTEQAQWLRSRDTVTTREHLEVLNKPRSLPRFTKLGFKLVEVPQDMQDLLVQFYLDRNHSSITEDWNSWGQTQISKFNVPTKLVDIQGTSQELRKKYYTRIVEWMKPRLEKWVGFELEQTSLYGMREYFHPHALRNHLDRPDVLVVSVTFSVFQEGFDHKKWPLEALAFDGNMWRLEHPQGTMMYYESATLQHGKPDRLPKGGKHVGLFLHYRPKRWMESGFVDFSQTRSSKAVKLIRDDRPRHRLQEGWPKHYYESEYDMSEYADLQEGMYFSLGNTCGNPADQRDDDAFQLSKQRWQSPSAQDFALMDAAKGSNKEEVERLLQAGANVNHADKNSWRALHEAARFGSKEVIEVLLAAGADTKAKTNTGATAFDLAHQFHGKNRQDLLRLLGSSEL